MMNEPTFAPRTWLFRVPLLGEETGEIESLTGYVARLADEHMFTPATLLHRALDWWAGGDAARVGQWKRRTEHLKLDPAINASPLAKPWIQILEKLGGVDGLARSTLGLDAMRFPFRGLLRHHHAWCPCCLQEDEQPFDRLLWSVAPVRVCPRHGVKLADRCPECGSRVPMLHSRSTPGMCPRCEAPLAAATTTDEVDDLERWSAKAVADYLTSSARHASSKVTAGQSLRRLMACHGITDAAELAREIGVSRITTWYWLHGRACPDLENVLRVCFRFEISVADFLSGRIDSRNETNSIPDRSILPRHRRRSPKKFVAATVEKQIADVVANHSDDPLPFEKVAKEVGFAPRTIRGHFPRICREISARYRAHCRAQAAARKLAVREELAAAVEAARENEREITRRTVGDRLAKPGMMRAPETRRHVEQLLLDLPAA